MKVYADGFDFEFPDAIHAFKFDEKDQYHPRYHVAPMKAVDIIVEFNNYYLFIEIKDFHAPEQYKNSSDENCESQSPFRWLVNYLKYKFRDSFLFRYAEDKVDKPIRYICVLTLDNALNSRINKELSKTLPVKKVSRLWKYELAESVHVVNIEKWNKNFPNWPLKQVNPMSYRHE